MSRFWLIRILDLRMSTVDRAKSFFSNATIVRVNELFPERMREREAKYSCMNAIEIHLVPISTCPTSFQCSLNCRLGYRVDSNGCLVCECQSCPAMDQCHKHCPSGYLKDLFNCDICECRDQCPPFACSILCPTNVGFAQAENGCPLCQCATSQSKPIESTSSCQVGSVFKGNQRRKESRLNSFFFQLERCPLSSGFPVCEWCTACAHVSSRYVFSSYSLTAMKWNRKEKD